MIVKCLNPSKKQRIRNKKRAKTYYSFLISSSSLLYVSSSVTQENNSGLKAKSAQKKGRFGLFSCFGKFASITFQENGDFVHRNPIMWRYLEPVMAHFLYQMWLSTVRFPRYFHIWVSQFS
jgi:hypothetical protein